MDDSLGVFSERVKSLASSIYRELEKMIQKYDEDCIKGLVPYISTILETLEKAYKDKDEQDNQFEQLVYLFEQEKQQRRDTEQRFLEVEDHYQARVKELNDKIESLENANRTLESKSKNSAKNVVLLEEHEAEAKKELVKLNERYSDLLKTHTEYVERTKTMSSDENTAFNLKKNASKSEISGSDSEQVTSGIQKSAVHMELMAKIKQQDESIIELKKQLLSKETELSSQESEYRTLLHVKEIEGRSLEEKYKSYLAKAKTVIMELENNNVLSNNSGYSKIEFDNLRRELEEKDKMIQKLQEEQERMRIMKEQEDRLITTAFHGMSMQIHRDSVEKRLLSFSGRVPLSFLSRQRQITSKPLQPSTGTINLASNVGQQANNTHMNHHNR